jgi:hypothetical protein
VSEQGQSRPTFVQKIVGQRVNERIQPAVGSFAQPVFPAGQLDRADFDVLWKLSSPRGVRRCSASGTRKADQPNSGVRAQAGPDRPGSTHSNAPRRRSFTLTLPGTATIIAGAGIAPVVVHFLVR